MPVPDHSEMMFLAACGNLEARYRCVSDTYDPNGEIWGFREFVEMCECSYGDTPDLHRSLTPYGEVWRDGMGVVVLREVPA